MKPCGLPPASSDPTAARFFDRMQVAANSLGTSIVYYRASGLPRTTAASDHDDPGSRHPGFIVISAQARLLDLPTPLRNRIHRYSVPDNPQNCGLSSHRYKITPCPSKTQVWPSVSKFDTSTARTALTETPYAIIFEG
ncbi:hypothetical protein SJ05684_b56620 (plasmid) [Sinorhizobium sojae CCBAU 05684]|uniref:Uncharacterized protein n=1 Tax=Sinorhizobium sojae CCBAU 05684 TaxID=716928 RepID=A0A249PLT2_9HYPH|nr:hypothetical protein SJ05684_b56620 [Sinorhizobium sojae CCBAU 05684]